jgi:hypothetical protein
MITTKYSENAKSRIDDYLNAIRDRLRASDTSDVQEVVDDLRGHIERELSGMAQPVSEANVERILARLGLPDQVVDEADMSWWRKMILRLRRGPEDWRLAYLSFAVLIVGSLLGGIGIIGSFLLSRAALSVAKEPEPKAKRWLIYPSLIIVYASIVFVGLAWPAALGGFIDEIAEIINGHGRLYKEPFFDGDGLGTILAALAGAGLGLSAWWSILWVVGHKHPNIVRVAFEPFAEDWTGRLFGKIVLGAWGLTVVLAGATVLLWIKT